MVETTPARPAELTDWATSRLAGPVAAPRRTAVTLLAHFLGGYLEVYTGTDLGDGVVEAFREAVGRVAQGEPLEYVLGVAGFRTLRLAVDSRVLIPRPETEGLVQLVLDWAADRTAAAELRVLDLGTGSGCIALSLAAEGSFSSVVATDVSPGAIEVARANAVLNGVAGLEFREGPYFEPVIGEKFDIIVTNPPYIAPGEYAVLEESVRRYEPSQALVSGSDGMEHIGVILSRAAGFVERGGLVALEIDSRRAAATLELANRYGWADCAIGKDVFDRPRFLIIQVGDHG